MYIVSYDDISGLSVHWLWFIFILIFNLVPVSNNSTISLICKIWVLLHGKSVPVLITKSEMVQIESFA